VTTTTTATLSDLERASLLLSRSGIDLAAGVDHDQAAAMLARVLRHHDLFGTPHGRLLLAACHARTPAEKEAGPRPLDEKAVRALLRIGESPTPAAVATRVEQTQQRIRSLAARVPRLERIAERDAAAAVEAVVGWWRRYGRPPSPVALGRRFRWAADTWAVIHRLEAAGWLAVTDGGVRPGPRGPYPAWPRNRRDPGE
jgi:hypothetical protein